MKDARAAKAFFQRAIGISTCCAPGCRRSLDADALPSDNAVAAAGCD